MGRKSDPGNTGNFENGPGEVQKKLRQAPSE